MGYTATYPRQRKTHPTAKNRVWGFFADPNKTRPANRLQPPELRRKIDPTTTKPVSGVFFYGYRFYDPVTGRWPSRDPIGETPDVNIYCFLNNGPISQQDYLGLSFWGDLLETWCAFSDGVNPFGDPLLEDGEWEGGGIDEIAFVGGATFRNALMLATIVKVCGDVEVDPKPAPPVPAPPLPPTPPVPGPPPTDDDGTDDPAPKPASWPRSCQLSDYGVVTPGGRCGGLLTCIYDCSTPEEQANGDWQFRTQVLPISETVDGCPERWTFAR